MSQPFRIWNAVLPLGSCWSLQQIGGSWCEAQRGALPRGLGSAPQPEKAGHAKRNANDIAEHGLVAVPADRCTGRVLGDQGLAQCTRSEARDALALRE